MKLTKEKIVITDPCYIKESGRPMMERNTIYGDWSCMVYSGKLNENKNPEEWDETYFKFFNEYNFSGKTQEEKEAMQKEFKEKKDKWLKEKTLGEFCADAGMVAVFKWDWLSERDQKWIMEHPWCAAVIPDVVGDVDIVVVDDSVHVVCEGETPFFSTQSGL